MTVITYADGVFKAEGHAMYAEHGYDIVCASVSMLAYTLAEALEDSKAHIMPGDVEISFPVTEKNSVIVEAILKGYVLLADTYPEHVCVLQR